MPNLLLSVAAAAAAVATFAPPAFAQERPFFVTYDHYLEEPGNVEIAMATSTGVPRGDAGLYSAPWIEFEYGVAGWWTAEAYFEGVTTTHDGSGFAGWRLENRFRPLKGEHAVNPVLYVEYENVSEASRIQKEIVGTGALPFGPIPRLRAERAHELEGKLILSSALGPWTVAENVIFEKNLSAAEGIEFGYSAGIARSLASLASGRACRFCRESFTAGVEAYGGLGSTLNPSLADTRHFIAPVLGWQVSDRSTLKVSSGFGLTAASDRYLFRVGWAYELPVRGGGR